MPLLPGGLGICDDPGHEVVRFYLQQARLLDTNNNNQSRIREKAYQVLVSLLSGYWDPLVPDEKLTQEVVDFFAEGHHQHNYGQPYREKTEKIVMNIWKMVKAGRLNRMERLPQGKEILVSRQQIAKALVRLELFDFIFTEAIVEAIPFLRERLSLELEEKLQSRQDDFVDRLKEEGFDSFPPSIITKETIAAALDKEEPWVFRLSFGSHNRIAGALIGLMKIKPNNLLSPK